MSTTATEKKPLLNMSLTTQILIATIGGVLFGSLAGPWAANLKIIGDIFIRLIQMNVVLLVMTAVAAAVGTVDARSAGRMGFHTFKWIIILTFLSAFLGLALGQLIQPGIGIQVADTAVVSEVPATSLKDTILGFFSTNIIGSMSKGDMIPSIIFALLFGLGMGTYTRNSGKTVVSDFIIGFNEVIMNIIKMVMTIAPIGIFALLATASGSVGFRVIIPMLKFLGALAIGSAIILVAYALVTALLLKINPLRMPKKFAKMSIVALTTTSSAVTLPTQMEDTVTKFGVSRKVTDFTGPITMSMNSNGAVMCYVIAALFMAQSSGIVMTWYQIGMAILLSAMLCMGTIVVPGGMMIVYPFLAISLGLPVESVAILIGIDWFSGMFRTIVNVNVDVLISMLVADKLGEFDKDVYNDIKKVEYVQG